MPQRLFPSVWSIFEELLSSERVSAPKEVEIELRRGSDGLSAWAKKIPNFIRDPSPQEISFVQQITNAYPRWVSGTQNAADPWVIAQADRFDATIVTQEGVAKSNADKQNLKIPNIANKYGLTYIDFNKLAENENWVF